MNKRTEIINYRLKKAHEELNNAKLSLDNELYSSSLSASYYAIFHAARALLAAESIVSKKHSSVIYLFSEHFIKPGIVNKKYSKVISSAFEMRIESDYADLFYPDNKDVSKQLEEAEDFISMIETILREKYGFDN